MQQLVGRRGPVPRLVFDQAHDVGADVRSSIALGGLQASDIKTASTQTSHRLVLIHPPGCRQGETAALSQVESRCL